MSGKASLEKRGAILPFLITMFMFILINNIIGLIPGAHPGTGTIGNHVLVLLLILLCMCEEDGCYRI